MSAKGASAPLSAGRKRLFTVVMVLVPVLFFGLLEGGLRLAGYGQSLPLFVPLDSPPGYLYQNRDVARRYFYHQQNVPTSLLDFFSAEKSPATYRIVVQGGSTAAGFPFYYGGAFSRMLQQRLQQTFPDRKIEVVNTAMAAVNSYTLLDLADEILAQRPDAVLIYAGHNEFYGALGVGSAESLGRSPGLVRAYLRLQRFRTVQLLRNGVMGLAAMGQPDAPQGNTLMARIVREQTIPYGSALYRAGIDQFEANLGALLARYERAGVPVLIGTVASNERDQPPFVSVQQEGHAGWDARVEAAAEEFRQAGTLDGLRALVAEDSLDARSRYGLARALEARGDTAAAAAYYGEARDRDALRFRASEEINAVIRAQAAAHGASVVPTEAALRKKSPGGIVGREMMLEHLHPTVEGYFTLADAFYDALRARGMIGAWEGAVPASVARRAVLLTPVDSLVGVYRLLQLKAVWPFQPVGVTLPYLDTLQARTPVEKIAWRLFRNEISWREANALQRDAFAVGGDLSGAFRAIRAAQQEYPFGDDGFLVAGNLLMGEGRYAEALPYFEEANRVEETSVGRSMAGALLLQLGRVDAAVIQLERAVALDASDVQARYNLAGGLAQQGRYAEALEEVDRVLAARPDQPGAEDLKQQLLQVNR